MPLDIHIDYDRGVPVYRQIYEAVAAALASGRLARDEQLPTIHDLANHLSINPNTVARAYRELELAGVVEKRRTTGTYVSGGASPLARRERLKILGRRVDALLAEARQMDVSLDDVIDLVRQRDRAMASS